MRYPVETFTAAERAVLEPHFTNLDRPVFCLVNLPETVKGALFARYSRYPGTLRRLFCEEFADDLPEAGRPFDGVEGERAAGLYERVFIGYGDDSIAQVGGAHVACEWASNVLTKILQRGRLAAYLEQSTRYIPYDRPVEGIGGYRYYSDAELGPRYAAAMDELFAIYSRSLETVQAWAAERWPRDPEQPERAWQGSIRAKALDLLRGLLPASTLSHVGIYASGQAYEQLLLHLAASPLPEARAYGEMLLAELQHVIPSFVARVDRPDRGGDWVEHLRERRQATERAVSRLGLDRRDGDPAPSVELVHVDGAEDDLLAASLYESAGVAEDRIRGRIAALDPIERAELIGELAGERRNRRHRPGRGWEAIRYRFEIVSDYGGFRDLQRHRMLTCQWQRLGPELGAGVPDEVREAGAGDEYERALELSRAEFDRLEQGGMPEAAPYALCLGYRIRYVLDLNAREAMHVCELRSGREGHPTYRAVAQAMHERISAVHPAVGAAMVHVDSTTEPRLERILSEIRTHRKQVAASQADAPPGVSTLG
ncbi:MAG TPA: FAD-dependent thymidylate synthase [Solirubrobacterales bacterium]|nr:FAD-dependent thymidylate synthase [Solirubrobacterales bacterium]